MNNRTRNWLSINALLVMVGLVFSTLGCQAQGNEEDSAAVAEAEGEAIFNGQDLAGWDGDARFWSVENGAIVGETTEDTSTEANTFLIWEGGEPSDFELTFDYRFVIVSDESYGNSGVQVRSERFQDEEHPDLEHRVRGHQADMAISDWIPGIHYDEGGRGIIARRGQRVHIDAEGERHEDRFAEEDALGEYINVHSEWNDYRVYARGDTIRASINGQLMHELIDESPEGEDAGIIAFQIHQGPPMRVELRDVVLTRL
jgi:hypothetical protein